jgi:hypothetical protein
MVTVLDTKMQAIVREHFKELHQFYRGLVLDETDAASWKIRGELRLSASYNGNTIRDRFHIEIQIPPDYPESVPSVWETEGRIPDSFHKYSNKSLCLGSPLNVKIKFRENPMLLWFVEELLIHYLFGFCSYERTGVMPFGELTHEKGMLESYKELFRLQTDIQTLQMLKLIAEGKYKGHLECPCGSGKRMRHCHGPQLIEISGFQQQSQFYEDYLKCILEYICDGNKLPLSFRNKKLGKSLGPKHVAFIFQR